MKISLHTLTDFSNIFRGNTAAHGVHVHGKTTDSKGKRSGKSWSEMTPPLESHYKDHLEGKKGLGISPINGENKVSFCVIDVDEYTETVNRLIAIIYNNRFPLVPFRTKSGGLHLYIFFKDEVQAAYAIDTMRQFVRLLSLSSKTEIFPKQKKLLNGAMGNWINLPYYNGGEPTPGGIVNGLVKGDLSIMRLNEAIVYIKSMLQDKQSINDFLAQAPLTDAPPCLQALYLSGVKDYRNEYLFNLSVYYKSKHGDDFDHFILDANNQLADPLPTKEVQDTVISAVKKKDYSYKCSNEPIVSHCNRSVCSARKYGIAGAEISQLTFEDFIQHRSDPPWYQWKVNGKVLTFYSEADIINQASFRQQCMRDLHILPNRLKEITWSRIVNNAIKNAIIKEVDPEDDISPAALFREYLKEFLQGRAMAKNKAQLLIGRVFFDIEKSRYVFQHRNLLIFLIHTKGFRSFGQVEIQSRLKDLGAEPIRFYIDKKRGSVRMWSIPLEAIDKFIERPELDDFNIEFEEDYKDSPY